MRIRNVVIAAPEPPVELGAFYAHLLGWEVIRTDWCVVAPSRDSSFRLAFGDGPGEYTAPRWPDPNFPQHMHLDIEVPELEPFANLAYTLGGELLGERDRGLVVADPAGHPFCIVEADADTGIVAPEIARVVIDCFSPRSLASFYEDLMGRGRVRDDVDWVELAAPDSADPHLAFQQSVVTPPRWPDPNFPQQIHLDLDVNEGYDAVQRAIALGGVPLPEMGGSCPVVADPAGHPLCLCSLGM